MRYDSHVADLLGVAAGLVNAQTCQHVGGRAVRPATGDALRDELSGILVRDGRLPHVEPRDVHVLARFAREARVVFEAAADEDLGAAATATNSLLAWTRPTPRLDQHGSAWDMHFHGPTDRLGDGWAAGCAAALTLALGSDRAGRLGVCAAPECDRVYVDASKNGSRSFCSVTCQNRVKNIRHRRSRSGRPVGTGVAPRTPTAPSGA